MTATRLLIEYIDDMRRRGLTEVYVTVHEFRQLSVELQQKNKSTLKFKNVTIKKV